MLHMEDAEFIANFRLSRSSFVKLCTKLRPLIVKGDTFSKNTVSVERRLAMTLNFPVKGNQFGVAVPTVCKIVHEITKAIVDILTPEYVKFPESDTEYLAPMATFHGKQIPNCVGAIDGSHIRILRPTECSTDFYNRKSYYSILLQGICDGNGKFFENQLWLSWLHSWRSDAEKIGVLHKNVVNKGLILSFFQFYLYEKVKCLVYISARSDINNFNSTDIYKEMLAKLLYQGQHT